MGRLNLEYGKIHREMKDWSLSRRFVPGDGPLNAHVMFIGQAPGRNEDVQKKPFVGVSGQFLTKLMDIAGLDRRSVYICSVVQYFPPDNRLPTDREIGLCRPFLFRQVGIVDPKVIVLLGSLACKTVLDLDNVMKNHGRTVRNNNRIYFISMHPAAAIRIRKNMPVMERDFKKLRKIINKAI
jgi:DNA polymerase